MNLDHVASTLTEHVHRPDPGRAEAERLIREHFGNERHRRVDGHRKCAGCGHRGLDGPGTFSCFGGPSLSERCVDCGIHWQYRIPWPSWDRTIELPAGQLELSL